MIKSNHIRTGNLFQYFIGEDGYEWEIMDLDWQDIKWCEEDNENFNKVYKPIPLTEEWLVKLGFEKTEDLLDMIYYELKGSVTRRYTICYNHEEWQFSLSLANEYTTLIYDEMQFQCVHHLQNLYFSLTGQELTLKR